MKNVLTVMLVVVVVVVAAYLLFWPVAVAPVSWQAPPNPGYTGAYSPNQRLAEATLIALDAHHGPEDVAVDKQGRVYISTHESDILVFDPVVTKPRVLARTGGRPLGIELDQANRLLVADAYRGLLRVSIDGTVETLVSQVAGQRLTYVNDVAVAPDGRIYFSDASAKFGAQDTGGTLAASLLDLMEHGGHGRLLEFDPFSRQTRVLLDGLQFANGVAVSPDGRFVLVAETAEYRILRYWLSGARRGQHEVLLKQLPGFPDNLSTGHNGRFWVALISPRSAVLDRLAPYPRLRKIAQRFPPFMRPQAQAYGHVLAFNGDGQIVANLQDSSPRLPMVTSAVEAGDFLYLGSLVAPAWGRLRRPLAGW